MSSTTALAAQAAASPPFAAFPGAHPAPATPQPAAPAPAPLFPQPWQRVLVVLQPGDPQYRFRVACFGTVTFTDESFCRVLLEKRHHETVVTDVAHVQWSEQDEPGTLPMWLFTRQPGTHCSGEAHKLQARNYDLILQSGEFVNECFFKEKRFLEIAGPHRQIALADVARLRPSK